MIMHQDDRRGAQVQPAADDLAGVYGCLVDGAFARQMIAYQAVAAVEVEHAHALQRQVRHVDCQVIEQRMP